MKTNRKSFTPRASVTAVRGALIAMAFVPGAHAADDAAALTQASSTVEVGAGYVSKDSFKFGEYNGLEKQGAYAIGQIDLRGGGSYDSSNATRWRVTGTDLGLETRDVTAEFGQQGRFRINFGYDELLRNRSDSYQTPYAGAGSNNFTLPANWLAPRVPQVNANNINFRSFSPVTGLANALATSTGLPVAPTAAQAATVNNILANDVPAFHNVDLYTKRSKYDAGFSYLISPQLEVKASYRHEDKTGYKPMSTVTSQVSEFAATIADPIDQTTDQYNLSLAYTGDRAFLKAAYYGSIFKNTVQSVTWQDVNDPTKSATMSSAPSNQFHQFLLTGGYNFSRMTKLVVTGSYARGTQNESFLTPATAQNGQLPFGLPTASLNGSVITKAFDAKLTSKPIKDLKLAAAYKYDDRDNRTSVNTYLFRDANEGVSSTASPFQSQFSGAPALGSQINIYANRPYSKQLNQLNLDADYTVGKGQAIKAGYDWQQIERSCPGSWINCADAPKTKEDTLRAEWRGTMSDISAKVGYAYSERRVNYDENAFLALVPMANVLGVGGAATNGTTVATQSAYAYLLQNGLTGFGPLAGLPATALAGNALIYSPNNNILPQALYGSRNNINELPGMRRFNMADRNRDKLRASVDWQANDKLSLRGGVNFNQDKYSNSVYGLTDAKGWTYSLDGNYMVSDDFSLGVFYTFEDQKTRTAGDAYGSNSTTSTQGQAGNTLIANGCYPTIVARNANAKMDPCLNWSTDMRDKVDTIGFGAALKNMMAGKLDLGADLVFTRARTDIGVIGGSYVNNPVALAAPAPALGAGVPAVFFIGASSQPTISTDTIELRLNAKYAIDKDSAVRVLYMYQRLKSTDYAYDGMQFGTGTNYLPTLEQAPNYTVHVIGVTYQRTFR